MQHSFVCRTHTHTGTCTRMHTHLPPHTHTYTHTRAHAPLLPPPHPTHTQAPRQPINTEKQAGRKAGPYPPPTCAASLAACAICAVDMAIRAASSVGSPYFFSRLLAAGRSRKKRGGAAKRKQALHHVASSGCRVQGLKWVLGVGSRSQVGAGCWVSSGCGV